MTLPKISIIVPVYKVEERLPHCVNSILLQSFKDFELLLIDDGSPDRCGEMCDKFAEQDSRVRVFHKLNGGVSSARNLGLDNAQGQLVMFIDSDDVVNPNCIELLYNHLGTSKLVVCGFSYLGNRSGEVVPPCIQLDKGGENASRLNEMLCTSLLLTAPWGKLFSRDLIIKNQLRFNEYMIHGEDFCFVCRYLSMVNSICFVDNPGYNYYVDSYDNTMAKYKMTPSQYLMHIHNLLTSIDSVSKAWNQDLTGIKDHELNVYFLFFYFESLRNLSLEEIKEYAKEYKLLRNEMPTPSHIRLNVRLQLYLAHNHPSFFYLFRQLFRAFKSYCVTK